MEFVFKMANIGLQYFQSIRVTDLVDIGILAFLVYQLFMFTRRSNMGGVLKGVAVIAVAVIAAEQIQLNAMSFILNRVVEVGLVALVIVFQQEIRHWLEQMGKSFNISTLLGLRGTQSSEMEKAIKQTVSAYRSLSQDKTGALIVFERKISLEDTAKNGNPLDCAVDAMLLKNLFWNKAPLHDGAVIVRDGRIISAGCMLPLTQKSNLSKELGMRHKAAIGASEHSDAVVAVVSEETGDISVAVGGMLKRHLKPELLEVILMNELIPEHAEKKQTSRVEGVKRRLRIKDEGEHHE